MSIKYTRMQVPLRRMTFEITPIKKWVENRCQGFVLNLFCGSTSLDVIELRIDSTASTEAGNPTKALHVMDALVYCTSSLAPSKGLITTVILDPPYSYRKSMEMYGGRVMSPFNRLKDAIDNNIIAPGGRVITFGHHSVSMGAKRSYRLDEVLILSHGGAIHDTLACVEIKE